LTSVQLSSARAHFNVGASRQDAYRLNYRRSARLFLPVVGATCLVTSVSFGTLAACRQAFSECSLDRRALK
ncbi:hypothetical protein, partial [Bradyrhizobium sp. sGM-13]|uniref:hypothetical protein n=1 Tax=Bradyrhizobium sp. sGM-13 TaxID=2831781 RepID=UPI001BD0750B